MNIRNIRKFFIPTVVIVIMGAVVGTFIFSDGSSDDNELGSMEVIEATSDKSTIEAKNEASEDISSDGEDSEEETDDVGDASTNEGSWFDFFESAYTAAADRLDSTYNDDMMFLTDCLGEAGSSVAMPAGDLQNYYNSLEQLDLDEAIPGDLVVFFDENKAVTHMGIKGINNYMIHVSPGENKVLYEYISEYGTNFTFARAIHVDYDKEEMKEKQEKTGYRHAEIKAADDEIDISAIENVKSEVETELNNKFSSGHPTDRCDNFLVTEVDTESFEGQAVQYTVIADPIGTEYTVRYIYDMNKIYVLQ